VDASFGKNVFVENTTWQHFTKENHEGMKGLLDENHHKKFPKIATIASKYRPNPVASNANKTTFRPSFNKNFIPMCSYIYAD